MSYSIEPEAKKPDYRKYRYRLFSYTASTLKEAREFKKKLELEIEQNGYEDHYKAVIRDMDNEYVEVE